MTWNFRVLAQEHKGELTFGIFEVFYNEDGIPDMCTEDAVGVVSETLPGLSDTLRWMRSALIEPILSYSDFSPGGKYYTDLLEDVTCAKCGECINRCECKDGFFFKEEEQDDA